jgi:nicotinamide-nucleotide amidase
MYICKMNCTIITIGDELLIGQVIDTNSAYIAQQLSVLGISIHRRVAISDSAAEIKSAITESWLNADIIITTGGLGPTKDDITKKTICELFQVGMKRNKETFEHVKSFFEARNRPFLDVNQAQADIPENAEVLFNARGTAPGMWIENQGKILISLPGVPFEMEYLITTHVLDRLKAKFNIPSLYYQHIQTMGLGESFLAQKIENIESKYPQISLAYLPSPLSVNLRLSGNEDLKAEIDFYASEIRIELAEFIFGNDTTSIEFKLIEKLKQTNQTITLVESCTGGYLANLLTNIKGASEVFIGGWNVYSNEFKHTELDVKKETLETYTAVSEEACQELLINALTKTKADFGISVVGYLEKSETVASPYAIISYGNITNNKTKKIDLFYPRVKSKEAIAKVALVSLYKEFLLNI